MCIFTWKGTYTILGNSTCFQTWTKYNEKPTKKPFNQFKFQKLMHCCFRDITDPLHAVWRFCQHNMGMKQEGLPMHQLNPNWKSPAGAPSLRRESHAPRDHEPFCWGKKTTNNSNSGATAPARWRVDGPEPSHGTKLEANHFSDLWKTDGPKLKGHPHVSNSRQYSFTVRCQMLCSLRSRSPRGFSISPFDK